MISTQRISSDRETAWRLAVAGLTVLGLALRVAAGRGELWLDEIWSIDLLRRAHSFGEIFWGISHDNNHFLNSVWLWIVGPYAPPLVHRAASIVLGSACAPLAAWAARRDAGERYGWAAGLLAAAFFALCHPFVHFGSEARGYAGMTAMQLWLWIALSRLLEKPEDRRVWIEIVASIALGCLFNLTMVVGAGMLCAAYVLRVAFAEGRTVAVARAVRVVMLAFYGVAPAGAAVLAGALYTHMIEGGERHAFTLGALADGQAAIYRATLGLPMGTPAPAVLAAVAAIAIAALLAVPAQARIAPLAALLGPAALEWLARAPNLEFARFHLFSATAFLLLVAEALACALASPRAPVRAIAIAGVAAAALGAGVQNAALIEIGRGDYARAVDEMEAGGAARYASNMSGETTTVVRYLATRDGKASAYVDYDRCGAPAPDWYVHSVYAPRMIPQPDEILVGPTQCPLRFDKAGEFPAWGLSGMQWTLYRRAAGPAHRPSPGPTPGE
ncbi:MAG: hypothetical protein KGM42_07735 [Hyphomicrobiales bacterium]|nr:hypothetical protein [Hyphomicrobiales bacterium]